MLRTLVLLCSLAPLTLAQGAPQDRGGAPVLTVGGHSFATWQEYTGSPLFRALNLRCGTRANGSPNELRPASDCSASSTTIKAEYAPTGNLLYRIPVVVHVIQATNGDGQISNARIQSQIDVLNEDFQALAGTLGENGTDGRIEFFLATVDPNGNPTNGITRSTNNTWFSDSGSYWNTLAWDPSEYLNIYTNSASGALGYVPDLPQGGLVGANHDRVVVLWSAFGRNAPIGAPFHLGRTATHEVGHYLGLYHTFDFGCGTGACYTSGDRICDTNPEGNPVFGCPGASSSCGSSDPFHNYMDYSDDDCYEEFTPEQVNRMRCTLANWRVDLHEPLGCGSLAAATIRNAGANLAVYSATPPVLGGSSTLSLVDPSHTSAVVLGYAAPKNQLLPNGFTLLVDKASAFFFRLSTSLPPGNLVLPVPNDSALCGATAYTQAVLLGGGGGLALSNAVDLTVGL